MPTLLPLAVLVVFATVVWRMWRQRDRVADEVASRFAEERGLEPTAVASPVHAPACCTSTSSGWPAPG